jgi:hypothetical protein
MDVYRALNLDAPYVLVSVLHQGKPGVEAAAYAGAAAALHKEIRAQFQAMQAALERWLRRQYAEQATEALYKLCHLPGWPELQDRQQAQSLLEREYQRLGRRIGSASLFGLQGSGEEMFSAHLPADPALARSVGAGHAYLASLGFAPARQALHESWFLLHGSAHYDLLEQLIRLQPARDDANVGPAHAAVSIYRLLYQTGESLAIPFTSGSTPQDVMFAFSHAGWPYSLVVQAIAGLMEDIAERMRIQHASFWQSQLNANLSKDLFLRLRLEGGEDPLRSLYGAIAAAEGIGAEALGQGALLLSTRIA